MTILLNHHFLPARDKPTKTAKATPTNANEPGSGTLNPGAANARPVVATRPAATAARYLLIDFIFTPVRKGTKPYFAFTAKMHLLPILWELSFLAIYVPLTPSTYRSMTCAISYRVGQKNCKKTRHWPFALALANQHVASIFISITRCASIHDEHKFSAITHESGTLPTSSRKCGVARWACCGCQRPMGLPPRALPKLRQRPAVAPPVGATAWHAAGMLRPWPCLTPRRRAPGRLASVESNHVVLPGFDQTPLLARCHAAADHARPNSALNRLIRRQC